MRRARALMVIAIAVAGWVSFPASSMAWSHGCGGPDATPPDFVGQREHHTGITGARVKIEWSTAVAPVLCTTAGADSFSSTWVAIGNEVDPNDIYQVGIDRCQGGGCAPTSGPDDTPYYFVAKGRGYSAVCGTGVAPTPVETQQGLATAGSLWYQIYQPDSVTFQTRIGGATAGVSMSTYWAGQCWGGVAVAAYDNEVFDIFDQTAGRTSDTQFWSSATWTNSSGTLVSMNRPFSSNCDDKDRSSMACAVASNLHDAWYTHDTRQ